MACHRRVVFLFAILCCWSGVAAAQFGGPPARRVSRPRPTTPATPAKPTTPAQGLGQLVVQDAQSDSPVRLNVARYHAHVVLQPPVALVQIDQSFYNPYDRQEEGTFVFNLPRGASVSRFAMYVTPGQLIEGELVERQRAADIYQSIVTRRRDPAILEQIGDNLFKMRVFPIPPKDTKRILLDYTIPLESSAGECRFRLPLFSDLEPIWDFRLTGVIRAAVRPDGAASPSHPAATFQRDADGTVRFELAGQNYQPQSDFLLSFAEQTTAEPTVRVSPSSRRSSRRSTRRPVPGASPAGCTSRPRFRRPTAASAGDAAARPRPRRRPTCWCWSTRRRACATARSCGRRSAKFCTSSVRRIASAWRASTLPRGRWTTVGRQPAGPKSSRRSRGSIASSVWAGPISTWSWPKRPPCSTRNRPGGDW